MAPLKVRDLTDAEKLQFQECLTWMHAQPNIDNSDAYRNVLNEARKRWPDIAQLIGFDKD